MSLLQIPSYSGFTKRYPLARFLILFTLSYFILKYLYIAYIGVLYPGGSFYWKELAHIDLIQATRDSLKFPVKWLLELSGFETRISNVGVGIQYGGGVIIELSCLGITIMIAYFSLMLAYPGKFKFLFLVIGLLLIHLLNILRIFGVVLADHYNKAYLEQQHDLFNVVAYIAILALFYYWMKKHGTMQ